jgi:adenylosuccinate lyase
MQRNLDLLGGLHNSQRVLLALTQAGLSARTAMPPSSAMPCRSGSMARLPAGLFAADKDVTEVTLSAEQMDAMFDDGYHLKHVDTIFLLDFTEPNAI